MIDTNYSLKQNSLIVNKINVNHLFNKLCDIIEC